MMCASAADSSAQSRNPPARRGAAEGAVSDVTVTLGGLEYRGRVDASCKMTRRRPGATRVHISS